MSTDWSYIGVGKVTLREVGSASAYIEAGNCSGARLRATEEVKKKRDYTQPGGGTKNQVRRITAVELTIVWDELSPANLARGFYGDESSVAAGAVTDEVQTAYKGGLIPTDYPIDTAVAPVVKAANGDGATSRADSTAYTLGQYRQPATPNGYFYKVTTAGTSDSSPPSFGTTVGGTTADGTVVWTNMGKITLVADTDYTVSAAGLYIASNAAIADGEDLEIDYTKDAASRVEALLNSGKEYEIVFDGLNEALSDRPVIVRAYRWRPGPMEELNWIGEDYVQGTQTGELLLDASITGEGLSKYFRADFVTA